MKLLLDQGLPRTAAELLRAAGFDTLHVGDIGYATATDAAILQLATNEQRSRWMPIFMLYSRFRRRLDPQSFGSGLRDSARKVLRRSFKL